MRRGNRHSVVSRQRASDRLWKLADDIRHRNSELNVPWNPHLRNALFQRWPDHWGKDGSRLVEANGISPLVATESHYSYLHYSTLCGCCSLGSSHVPRCCSWSVSCQLAH